MSSSQPVGKLALSLPLINRQQILLSGTTSAEGAFSHLMLNLGNPKTLMERRGEALDTLAKGVSTVDCDTVIARYIRQPTAQDRLLNFVGELLRQ